MPAMMMKHKVDPAKELLDKIGDLSGVTLFFNGVMVAIYKRPEQTASGLYLADKSRDEDIYQGKVGLVVKKGPLAFQDDENVKFNGQNVEVGDWIVFRPSDGWQWNVNKTECRMLRDVDVKARIAAPDSVW
jgi:co-chaperonin GroES (HSP10)